MLREGRGVHHPVVEETDADAGRDVSQNALHQAAIGGRPLGEAEPQPLVLEEPKRGGEGRLLAVPLVEGDAVEGPFHVEAAEDAGPGEPGEVVRDVGHGVAVLLGHGIEAPPVDTPPDAASLLLGCDQVGAPGAVGGFDHVLLEPPVQLLPQIRFQCRVDGPVLVLDGVDLVGEDAVLEQVRHAEGAVQAEEREEPEQQLGGLAEPLR